MSLSAIILTRNEAHNVEDCIESLRWADSILVFDSFSTDDTVNIAKSAGARVEQRKFDSYTGQRNAALQTGGDEWVYFVDADERSSHEQGLEIRKCTAAPEISGYWVPRHNYIFGKLTRHTGWYPDYQLRLLRREKAHYDTSRDVHELVVLDGQAGYLQTPLVHYNYRDLAQFIDKQQRYTEFAARDLFRQGIRVKPQNYILQPLRHFRWRFLELQGYRDGIHGLRLSVLMSWYEYEKYVLLAKAWKQARAAGGGPSTTR
ncbi:MAG TPA: glycosyltransferase family 2 protein [Aggregatilineales bacterium]|nr:glycosyltransferase family 2 protein [Aggregatilineales bacterium]